ncbi:MAG: hypothetical protein J4432_04400 [DPANN group archaeon]|nr:hypothetical protein [DPANN group archaeon]
MWNIVTVNPGEDPERYSELQAEIERRKGVRLGDNSIEYPVPGSVIIKMSDGRIKERIDGDGGDHFSGRLWTYQLMINRNEPNADQFREALRLAKGE